MTPEQYRQAHEMIKNISRLITSVSLKEFIQECENYETYGYLYLKPFEWKNGLRDVRLMKELASKMVLVEDIIRKHDENIKRI